MRTVEPGCLRIGVVSRFQVALKIMALQACTLSTRLALPRRFLFRRRRRLGWTHGTTALTALRVRKV